jgi:hypothetical protein
MTDNMTNTDLSRRRMIATGLGLVSANSLPAQTASPTLTAGEVIARIKKNVGIPWMDQTVDNLIAGSADTPVKGIATTMMATLDVMQRAAVAGRNMVITHESTFYSHQDTLDQLKNDPVYLYKTDFIRKNGMASFHFHDHWHRRWPDGIAVGMARELGWDKYADANNPRLFTLPQTALGKLVKDMQAKLNIRTMRVVGSCQRQLGICRPVPRHQLGGAGRYRLVCLRRDPRVGTCGVFAGHDLQRPEEGDDRHGPRGLRAVGDEVLR